MPLYLLTEQPDLKSNSTVVLKVKYLNYGCTNCAIALMVILLVGKCTVKMFWALLIAS